MDRMDVMIFRISDDIYDDWDAGDTEMPICRPAVCDGLACHEMQSHGIGERQILIRKPAQYRVSRIEFHGTNGKNGQGYHRLYHRKEPKREHAIITAKEPSMSLGNDRCCCQQHGRISKHSSKQGVT